MKSDYEALSEVQLEVMNYLEEHQNAADTAEGIRQWWLFQRMAKLSHELVKEALDELKEANLIETQVLDNGDELFRLIRSRNFKTSEMKVNALMREFKR